MPRKYTHPWKQLWRPATRLKQLYQCSTKLGHFDFLTAMQHANACRRERPDVHVNIYECRWCGLMHVGRASRSPELPAEVDVKVEAEPQSRATIGDLQRFRLTKS